MTTCDCEACFKNSENNKDVWHNLFVKKTDDPLKINLDGPTKNGSLVINKEEYVLKCLGEYNYSSLMKCRIFVMNVIQIEELRFMLSKIN